MSYRLAAAAFGLVCAVTAVVGCSAAKTAAPSGNAISASAGGPAATSAATVVPTAGPSSQSGSRSAKASDNGVTVSITGLPGKPVLAPGGSALDFTVNIRNSSKRAYHDITPVVAMEHCTCVSTQLQPAPAGRLQEFSLVTGKWRTVSYDTIGTGKDYLDVVEQSPLTINPRGTISFSFRISFSAPARQAHAVRAGQTGLLVSVVQRKAGTKVLATVRVSVRVSAG